MPSNELQALIMAGEEDMLQLAQLIREEGGQLVEHGFSFDIAVEQQGAALQTYQREFNDVQVAWELQLQDQEAIAPGCQDVDAHLRLVQQLEVALVGEAHSQREANAESEGDAMAQVYQLDEDARLAQQIAEQEEFDAQLARKVYEEEQELLLAARSCEEKSSDD